MSVVKQTFALMKQELRSASRTRYIVISFILMPLLMWGIQGGVQLLIGLSLETSQEGEEIFVVNLDDGNGTHNLGDIFVDYLKYSTQNDSTIPFLQGAIINDTRYTGETRDSLMTKVHDPKLASSITPLIIIPQNFTAVYNSYNYTSNPVAPVVELYTLPGGLIGSELLQAGISTILSFPPFTQVTFHKASGLYPKTITFPGEESAASGFGVGFIGFISIIIAVMAPAPFVSTSFAGEREKKTMESLLALPISRFNILLGKLLAGMVLISIFAVMNMIGLFAFSFVLSLGDTGGEFNTAEMYSIEPSLIMLLLIGLTMFLSAFIAIGFGISIASLTKDVRSAESMYSMVMMLPSLVVGMSSMFGSLPEESFGGAGIFLYIIPWSHAIAILFKGMYPQTYASSTLTGSIATDLLFHIGYLVVIILVALYIASRVFEREGILN
jgi:ABC-type Na+ efflux pump permease subunit